jgi:hypothetical protein
MKTLIEIKKQEIEKILKNKRRCKNEKRKSL